MSSARLQGLSLTHPPSWQGESGRDVQLLGVSHRGLKLLKVTQGPSFHLDQLKTLCSYRWAGLEPRLRVGWQDGPQLMPPAHLCVALPRCWVWNARVAPP